MSRKPFINRVNTIKNKKGLSAIALILLMSLSAAAAFLPSAAAHTPPWTYQTYAYVTAQPSPVGVGQTVIIVFWLDIPPPTASGGTGDRWRNERVTITKPDGTVVQKGPFNSDPVGSQYLTYMPDAAGVYNVTFTFPGQTLSASGPNTPPSTSGLSNVNDTYLASSASTSFTVQQEQLTRFTRAPLPGSYWTRPIDALNTNWNPIASSWLGLSAGSGFAAIQGFFGHNYMKFQPYGRAPDTAHVIWTKPISFGGLVGGGNSITPGMTFYSGTAYELKFSYPIIMYGNVYYSLPEANDATGNGVTGVNLRTGETLWTNPNVNSFAFGQFYDYESPNQHGTIPNGYLWAMSGFGSSAKWMAVDPFNGKLLFNLTAVPSGGQYVVGPQGEMLKYILGRRNNTSPYTFVNVWNNTAGAGETAGSDPVSRAEWRPNGKEINMSQAYSANITLSQGLPSGAAIIQVWHGDMIFGTSSLTQAIGQTETGWGTPDPWTMWAINLNPSRGQVGNVMWIRNYTAPDGNKTVLFGPRDGETHIWTIYYRETMQWTGFDLLTGDQKWGPTASENNWNYYGGTTSLTTPYAMGYSTLYAAGFSGILYAYDMATGQLKFTYGNNASDPYNSTSSGLETVYGVYPMQVAAVGNDKVYLVPSEHSLNAPPYAGARVRAVNAHNGKELWKMHGMVNWQSIALADGYFVYINYNDMQIYALGPGPSATTVSASPKVVPQGGSVMIEGTVTDQSPQTSLKGTAAISDKDQGPWMEATIMKNAVVPMDATGVPVTIVAIDSQGTVFDVGTVTSDTGGLFHKLWTPPAEGEYTIIARFDGSGSYGGSAAETSVGVTAAPSASPPASPTVSPTTAPPTVTPISTPSPSTPVNPTGGSETALYVGIAAAVIIIAIAASAVILRRRK